MTKSVVGQVSILSIKNMPHAGVFKLVHTHHTHHELLLCATHAGASLCVLMCSDQQLNQSGNSPLFSQGSMVCRAQSQVTDQTDCSLMDKHIYKLVTLIFYFRLSSKPFNPEPSALPEPTQDDCSVPEKMLTNASSLGPSVQRSGHVTKHSVCMQLGQKCYSNFLN